MKPTVEDYRPGGKYRNSVLISLDGTDTTPPPLQYAYPPSDALIAAAKMAPFHQALLEELERRNCASGKPDWGW